MQITCYGAAGEVTGSQHLVETDRVRLLLDCGLFQGPRAETYARNARFHCRPQDLDGVVLSHGHIDHSGNLPGLYRAGFSGPVFCTPATADVAEVMLLDSARIQEEDADFLRGRLDPDAPPVEPLYRTEDVRRVSDNFETLSVGEWHRLSGDLRVRFHYAGHILGAAVTEIELTDAGETRRVVFTGDLGRRHELILPDPEPVDVCDVLITESTYGNSLHALADEWQRLLCDVFAEAARQGGRVVIPAFSLGRTQALTYLLGQLAEAGRLPAIPVFVDSPLAGRLDHVYTRHEDDLNPTARARLDETGSFSFPGVQRIETRSESAALNHRAGAFAVIAASGMGEHGRIRHHLRHALADQRNTVLLAGFQAANTLGRRLADGVKSVRVLDRDMLVRARIVTASGLSAHADAEDFRWWFGELADRGGTGQAIIVHGEPPAAQATADLLRDVSDEEPIIAEWGKTYTV